ncbi:hypothetical protein HMPREF3150_06421 [Pseudomonas aeruginosa]|nr:hypothetical protein HMPREF3150_06421 [Pseudomonas aeruginosa]
MTSSPRFGVAPRRFSRDGAASGACRNTVTRVAWGRKRRMAPLVPSSQEDTVSRRSCS